MANGDFKVTNNSNEMSFNDLFSQASQVQIPLFQREYVWTKKQLDRFMNEIDKVVSGEDSTRFLGAIITVAREPDPPKPQIFEIVDGQQRLSTLYIFVLCAAYVAAKNDEPDYALEIINRYLIIPYQAEGANTKLLSSFEDRGQFNNCFSQVRSLGNLEDQLTGKIRTAASSSNSNGVFRRQFDRIQSVLQRRVKHNGIDHLKQLVTAATTKLTFVFIVLKDASNATTVFEGLNDPGIPIGIGDLIRNEVFSKLGDDPEQAIQVHQDVWKPFRDKLGDGFNDYFFPFGITNHPSVNRSDLFSELRKAWSEHSNPNDIIKDLSVHADDFNLIQNRPTEVQYPDQVDRAVSKLRDLGAPSSTYPFLFHVLKAVRSGDVDSASCVECLEALESFLVRRAIVGREPTGLLVFFRTAWAKIKDNPNCNSFIGAVRDRGTIEWPGDEQVKEAILKREIYKSAIRNFLLAEYDKSLGGDVPLDIPWIEHVMPQSLSDAWKPGDPKSASVFTSEDHKVLKHTWGNLVPLSKQMNQGVSRSAYAIKKKAFENDSMFKSARKLAEDNNSWTAESIRARSKLLGEWATIRWSHS